MKSIIFSISTLTLMALLCTGTSIASGTTHDSDKFNTNDSSQSVGKIDKLPVTEDYSLDSVMTEQESHSFLNKLNLAVAGGTMSLEEAQQEALKENLVFHSHPLRANPDFPISETLSNTPYVSQGQNGKYCGPASGTMIARQWGKPISIGTMADYMQTDTYQATDWSRGQFVSGLNHALGKSFYSQHNSPSAISITTAFQTTVGHYKHPIAADTVEFKGGITYNNHAQPTNNPRGHWIVGYGYRNNGSSGFWYDPGAAYLNSHGSNGVNTSFIANSNFMYQFLQSNGIVF